MALMFGGGNTRPPGQGGKASLADLVSETAEAGPLVPVFTSVEGLARFAGACGWASTTVEDLVGLLPEGVRALVDPLGKRPFLLDARTLREAEDGDGDQDEGADDGGS